MPNILFVNSLQPQCGVHQFGKRTYNIIKYSKKYQILQLLCGNWNTLVQTILTYDVKAVIFNYHPSTMGWVNQENLNSLHIPKLALYHEVPITGFDYYIHLDPTYFENGVNFTTGRPLFEPTLEKKPTDIFTVSSMGFGFHNKGFDRIITKVQEEFDTALIRLNIPYADFGDSDGRSAREIADKCRSLIYKPNITVNITHDFMSNEDLLNWLSYSDLNCALYDNMYGRGISSVVDYFLSVKVPFAVSNTWMMRHVRNIFPTITTDNASLKWIADNGHTVTDVYRNIWSNNNLIKDYERIIDSVI